jgi:hypothetical protein
MPPTYSASSVASFQFSSSEADSQFRCAIDNGAFSSCNSPTTYTALSDGLHSFKVKAVDAAGNEDPTPVSYTWTVDTIPPNTTLAGQPASRSNSSSASFSFTATESGSTFQCQLDNGGYSACTSPKAYAALPDGSHTFAVMATDAADNTDPTPATWTWTVDITPPAMPSNVTATPGDQIALITWNANSEPDLAGYLVYRSTTPGGPYSKITANLLIKPLLGDKGLTNGVTYYYVITALDVLNNESPPSSQASVQPSLFGQWDPVPNTPVRAFSAALLPTGKVLMFQFGGSMYLWNPKTWQFSTPFSANTNLFCEGLAQLADGRLIAVGGHEASTNIEGHTDWLGLRSAEIFNPWDETWTKIPDMAGGERWYPTAITLSDGRVLVTAGIDQRIPHPHVNFNVDLYDPTTNQWQVVGQMNPAISGTYPWEAVMPSGDVLFYGPQSQTYLLDVGSWSFQQVGNMSLSRGGGNGVLLDPNLGKVFSIGGSNPPANTAEGFNPSTGQWSPHGSMAYPRYYPNSVLLPGGQVLIIGGSYTARGDNEDKVLTAELYDPGTGQWTAVGNAYYGHGYHSTGLLLPDGSVLAAGPNLEAEVFYPWYFFVGERPAILSHPGEVRYGESFIISTSSLFSIAKVVMIRTSSTTHSLNTDQRYLELSFTPIQDGQIQVTAPAHSKLAIPGYYLLFVVDELGVPSEGVFLLQSLPSP